MNIKNIIFDFNGTLIDDRKICLDILNELLRKYGLKEVSMDQYIDIFDFPVIEYYKKVGFDFSKISFNDIAVYFNKRFLELFYSECQLYPEVISTLDKLKDKNLYILSASEQDNLDNQVKYLGIYNRFKRVRGTNSTHGKGKLHEAFSLIEEEGLNREETLLVGDSTHDYEVAQRCGFKCLLIASGHQAKYRLEKVCPSVEDDFKDILKYID